MTAVLKWQDHFGQALELIPELLPNRWPVDRLMGRRHKDLRSKLQKWTPQRFARWPVDRFSFAAVVLAISD